MKYTASAVAIILVIAITGCASTGNVVAMDSVKTGDQIAVDYWGTLDDGTQFDSSEGKQPLEFEAGAGQMIKGFDDAVIEMKVGEEKTVKISPAEAYGEYDQTALVVVPIEQLQQSGIEDPQVGQTLYIGGQPVKITKVTETEVTIDANHPLAGKTLTFRIKLVSINGKN